MKKLIKYTLFVFPFYLISFTVNNIIAENQDTVTSVRNDYSNNIISNNLKFYHAYPIPFNPSTVISYQLSAYSKVTLKVYDSLGRETAILLDKEEAAGNYKIEFNSEKYKLSSGVYFARMQVTSNNKVLYSQTKKLSLIK